MVRCVWEHDNEFVMGRSLHLIDSVLGGGGVVEFSWLAGRSRGTVMREADAGFDPRYQNSGWALLKFDGDTSKDCEDISQDGEKVTRWRLTYVRVRAEGMVGCQGQI